VENDEHSTAAGAETKKVSDEGHSRADRGKRVSHCVSCDASVRQTDRQGQVSE
jgi:thioredoxin reductase